MKILIAIFLAILVVVYSDDCTISDYESSYTECKENKRTVVYYWKEGTTCTGGVTLPPPKYNLPCDIPCEEGEYLPIGALSCSSCDKGTFSIGSGVRITNWLPFWKTSTPELQWQTYCASLNWTTLPNTTCAGWSRGDTGLYINSGDTPDSAISVLTIPIFLLTEGHVHFEYRVDAEPKYDKLIFELDGEIAFSASDSPFYQTFQRNLAKGYHTLTWMYQKDYELKDGEDAAFIRMFEVGGITYAQDECYDCPLGTYADQTGSEDCKPCPPDTYGDVTGLSQCKSCPADKYSYSGSLLCTPREQCSTKYYSPVWSECVNGQRTKSFEWLEPKICYYQNYTLPPPVTGLPCDACNPGTYRNTQTWNCDFCPTGQAGNGSSATCNDCKAGTAAIKGHDFYEWTEMPLGSSTGCIGDCANDGFRLMNTFIDTGMGHGAEVTVWFSFNVTLQQRVGTVQFKYTIECEEDVDCRLEFVDEGFVTTTYNSGSNKIVTQNLQYLSDDEVDGSTEHSLNWVFHKYDPLRKGRYSRLILYYIDVVGTEDGGAAECTDCQPGYFSNAKSDACTMCPPGKYSNKGSPNCIDCPVNTFNDRYGGSCLPCGAGTTSPKGATDCSHNCGLKVPMFAGSTNITVEYDLSRLRSEDEMYGPIYDSKSQQYFLNVCSKEHHNHTCYDKTGNAIVTYACQITRGGYGVDLGRVIGFSSLPYNPRGGLVVSYTQGTKCDNGPRETNITFICDPSMLGVGKIVGENPVEDPTCRYNFKWNTILACPLCTSLDYSFAYGECQNGRQQKFYYWRPNPKRCHDGVSLPPFTFESCYTPTVACPAGQFAEPGKTTCQKCPAGFYNHGPGAIFTNWQVFPDGFSQQCSSPGCRGWQLQNHAISANEIGTSQLNYNKKLFQNDGTVEFEFRMTPDVDYLTSFNFKIDGQTVFSTTKLFLSDQLVTIPVTKGTHNFTWEFKQPMPSTISPHVSISRIGFNDSTATSSACFPCPQGFTSAEGSAECTACGVNEFTDTEGSPECESCGPDAYSYPGSDECRPILPCRMQDFGTFYTACQKTNGVFSRVRYYNLLDQIVCSLDNNTNGLNIQNETVDCAPCPDGGERLQSGDGSCTAICAAGGYSFDSKSCQTALDGFWVARHSSFFDELETSIGHDWPAGWGTNCSGVCGTVGWRILGSSIDSGNHAFDPHGEVDSWVYYDANFVSNGRVEFEFTSDYLNFAFQFFIDGIVQPNTGLTKSVVEIPEGKHRLLWNVYQPNGERAVVELKNIHFVGLSGGFPILESCAAGSYSKGPNAESCSLCPPGTASDERSSTCTACPVNTYSNTFGSAVCRSCYTGSYTASAGSTACISSCIFNATEVLIDTGVDIDEEIIYSLADLKKATSIVKSITYGTFMLNPCTVVEEDGCKRGGAYLNTSVCYIDKYNNVIDNGNQIVFVPSDDPERVTKGFRLQFFSGDVCDSNQSPRSSSINFVCSDTTTDKPTLLSSESSDCSLEFMWYSLYACPVCKDTDYQHVEGNCISGKQTIQLARKSLCNGPALLDLPESKCSNLNVKFPIGIVIASAIAFIALFAVAIFVFVKNRRISHQYNRLQESFNARGHVELDNLSTENETEKVTKFSIEG